MFEVAPSDTEYFLSPSPSPGPLTPRDAKKAVLDRRILGGCDPALVRIVAGSLSANAKGPNNLCHIG